MILLCIYRVFFLDSLTSIVELVPYFLVKTENTHLFSNVSQQIEILVSRWRHSKIWTQLKTPKPIHDPRTTQSAIACSNLAIEILKQGVKYTQS